MQIKTVATTPFAGQSPGTSGLRKKTAVFARPHYAENFIQAVFQAAGPLRGKMLILGGDGRYYNREIIQIALKMAAAQGAGKIIVGQGGLLSTPAASHLIRKYRAAGGLIFSASHNAGGPEGDFGIKYNIGNGGPAPEKITRAIFAETQKLSSYHIAEMENVDIDKLGSRKYGATEIKIINPVRDYADMMEDVFDFSLLRRFCAKGFRFRFDAMNAITGPYAHEIFEKRLGLPQGTVMRGAPLPDFGNAHPDPNPVYAKDLYDAALAGEADFGAASDGDGDRNMIVGKNIFVSPSDSLALLAANAALVKAYKNGLKGIARSMPTSMAADRVAAKLGLPLFETPTGWKFFGNLLDSGKVSLCGEESFGTGSGHVREKDGLWAVLMWLNILAATGKSVKQLVEAHWASFGRNYYSRHDYEGVDAAAAEKMMEELRAKLPDCVGREIAMPKNERLKIVAADDFSYRDPVDNSVSSKQGIRLLLAQAGKGCRLRQSSQAGNAAVKARCVFRLSGTGTEGATLRLYLEYYQADISRQHDDVQRVLAPLAHLAGEISGLKARLNRSRPSVIV